MEREAFISRISRAAMTAHLPPPSPVPGSLPDLEPVDDVALFRERAVEAEAVVHGPISRHGVPRAVVGIAAGHGCRSFLAWDDLPAAGVATALSTAGLERVDGTLPPRGRKDHQMSYRDLNLGITGAVAGLAESGSLVLTHGPGRPRMASLAAEVHIALLDVTRIERTLAHWVQRNASLAEETSNLVVITGPSRTADIGQQLNLGVHGPKHVHVVLVR